MTDINKKASLMEIIARIYASFWDWKDKEIKECGILKDFAEAISIKEKIDYINIRENPKDPPDCFADLQGHTYGFELVELVDEEHVKEAQKSKLCRHKEWSEAEIVEKIQKILSNKGKKILKNFDNIGNMPIILLIHTDELFITYDKTQQLLKRKQFKSMNIEKAYLFFSYDPKKEERYPYIQLKLQKILDKMV